MGKSDYKFEINIPMKVVAKQRPRFNRKTGNVYTPPETVMAEKTIAMLVRAKLITHSYTDAPFKGPIELVVVFTFERPKNVKNRVDHVSRPDVENCGKLVADALNGVLYVDDSQIIHMHYYKQYGEANNIHIRAEELMSADDNGQKPTTLRKRGQQ